MSRIALILLISILLLAGGYILLQRMREIAIVLLFAGCIGLLLSLLGFSGLL